MEISNFLKQDWPSFGFYFFIFAGICTIALGVLSNYKFNFDFFKILKNNSKKVVINEDHNVTFSV